MFVVTSNQMYQAECAAVKRGISFPQLMENAGCACASIIKKIYGINKNDKKNVLVLCGKGKNGGDGFVIARKLWEHGCNVTVMLACGEPKAKDAIDMFSLVETAGIDVVRYDNNLTLLKSSIENADIIVEAIFGTGFSGSLNHSLSVLAQAINAAKAPVVAIDVPAGADCDIATVQGAIFNADVTIAISAYKPIHILKPCNKFCGKIVTADIGIVRDDFRKIDVPPCITLTSDEIRKLLPKRKVTSNKGTYGHALCICASMKMVGAAHLAVGGALRCGAGLVTAAFPQSAYAALAPRFTESLLLPLESNIEGTFAFSALHGILAASEKATAILVGCGMGLNKDTVRLISSIIKESKKPLVIDADGINALSTNIDILKEAQAPIILTPHPGEMSRLCKKSITEILANPVAIAREFAKKHGVTVVLKTANTVVCDGKNDMTYINTTGNSGLSRGGSGDLLAGMTVSFLAQGIPAFDAAVCAVHLHGLCADYVAKKTSMRGMLPTDVLNALPELFSKFE